MLFKIDVFFVLLKKLLLNQSTSKNLFVDVPNVAYENQSFIREKRTVKEVVSSCLNINCVKSAQILSFFWSVFSHIRTEYGEILRISPYAGKCGPEKTPYLDTFHAVISSTVADRT